MVLIIIINSDYLTRGITTTHFRLLHHQKPPRKMAKMSEYGSYCPPGIIRSVRESESMPEEGKDLNYAELAEKSHASKRKKNEKRRERR